MSAKKLLVIGIGKKDNSKQRMVLATEKSGVPYIFMRWSDISFFGQRLYNGSEILNLDEIGAVFFDIHRFTINTQDDNGGKKETDFHLENELYALLTFFKKHDIYALNRDFFLKYPFYNKFTQAELFSSKGIAFIPTLHLCDNKLEKISAKLEELDWNFPLVAKESYGARGSKVWKIENVEDLKEFVKERRNQSLVFQPFIENNADYRAIVIGGVCVGIMQRSAKDGEWKNNFSLGGTVAAHHNEEMARFAQDACRKLNLDIAGLDIFATEQGFLIIEINLFFGLDGFESIYRQADVSGKIMDLIKKNYR